MSLIKAHLPCGVSVYTKVMKSTFVLLVAGLAVALASCAPTQNSPQLGRIVNVETGEEGQISFTSGSLRPRIGDPFAADNVVIRIGKQSYSGRSVVINSAAQSANNWGFSVGIGAGKSNANSFWNFDTDNRRPAGMARTGNLVARTASAIPKTMTCTLVVDEREHGIGECTDSSAKYILQF